MKEARTRPLMLQNARDNEVARHPFRRSLSLEGLAQIDEQAASGDAATRSRRWLNENVSLFVLSFSAFFTAFYAFIF